VQRLSRLGLPLALTCALAALASVMLLDARAIGRQLAQPLSLAGSDYAGSKTCRSCHPGNYASWHRTFHRTMTQEATETSVLGDFAHGSLDYLGVHARMRRDAQGRFVIDWSRHGGLERWSAIVERTVGSRRYQQYLARDADVYYRLPIAWNIEEQRFMHMNAAFLTPDPVPALPGAAVERADYDRHVTRWNDNCVYCHNVAPNPGLDRDTGRFATQVAELGIACEACHGPAAQHIAKNRDPLRRLALHLGGDADPTIANPKRLRPERSAQICGHCHGQRITPDIERVHRDGDRFVPGEDLAHYSRPLARDTSLDGEPGVFAARFWPDGTARLTAYEYQGLLQSACAREGQLTCTTCHAMHAGDPRGQLRPEQAGDAACTSCHTTFADERASAAHSRHRAGSTGTRCVDCHMPRVVYGLVGAHRSHRIDSPKAARGLRGERPDACALCHVDQSRAWIDAALTTRFSTPDAAPPRVQQAPPEAPAEATELLLAGDPIERALAADALGRVEPTRAGALVPPRVGLLFDVLAEDSYPAVRAIAWRSLRALIGAYAPYALPKVSAFTATDTREQRLNSLARLKAALPAGAAVEPSAATLALRAKAPDVQISIGE
jgi:predicted CXXCH cytochrome family protein